MLTIKLLCRCRLDLSKVNSSPDGNFNADFCNIYDTDWRGKCAGFSCLFCCWNFATERRKAFLLVSRRGAPSAYSSRVDRSATGLHREYLLIYRVPEQCMIWLLSLPLSSSFSLSLSFSGRGWLRSQIMRQRESLIIYNSFNTLWPAVHITKFLRIPQTRFFWLEVRCCDLCENTVPVSQKDFKGRFFFGKYSITNLKFSRIKFCLIRWHVFVCV
jgi:hypothetical protein